MCPSPSATAGQGKGEHESDWLGADPVAAYAAAANADHTAWAAPDVLNRTVTISLGRLPGPMAATVHLTELLAHGCDIAIARRTGGAAPVSWPRC